MLPVVSVLSACLFALAAAELKYERVHVVDYSPKTGNWIFRGNFPSKMVNGTEIYAYEELVTYMQRRAKEEAGLPLPSNFTFHAITLNNIFEFPDYYIELDFFKNPTHGNPGNLSLWMLIGALIPPQDTPEDIRQYLVDNPSVLWGVDQLPSRVDQLKAWLETKYDKPAVMYYHCEAGCDRTGELSAAYYISHQGYNLTEAFKKDTNDCGRAPNYFSKGAIGWYCLTYEHFSGKDIGDCLNF